MSVSEINATISTKPSFTEEHVQVPQLEVDKAHKTLGCWVCPTMNQEKQIYELKKLCINWVQRVSGSFLKNSEVILAYETVLSKQTGRPHHTLKITTPPILCMPGLALGRGGGRGHTPPPRTLGCTRIRDPRGGCVRPLPHPDPRLAHMAVYMAAYLAAYMAACMAMAICMAVPMAWLYIWPYV